jgi:hypothetical protein
MVVCPATAASILVYTQTGSAGLLDFLFLSGKREAT